VSAASHKYQTRTNEHLQVALCPGASLGHCVLRRATVPRHGDGGPWDRANGFEVVSDHLARSSCVSLDREKRCCCDSENAGQLMNSHHNGRAQAVAQFENEVQQSRAYDGRDRLGRSDGR
jgi:hypothetical protein